MTPYIREYPDGQSYYGYGWVVGEIEPGDTLIWHNGGAMPHGWSCAVYYFKNRDQLYIAFSNKPINGILPVDNIAISLARIAAGKPVVMPPEVRAQTIDIKTYIPGVYELTDGSTIRVKSDSIGLCVIPFGQPAADLLFPSQFADRLPKYNTWTGEIVTTLASRKWEAAVLFCDPELADPERWRDHLTSWWHQIETENGAIGSFTHLGTIYQDGVVSFVRLNGESDSTAAKFRWMDGRCIGFNKSEWPVKRLLPTGPERFVSFSFQTGTMEFVFSENGHIVIITAAGHRFGRMQ